MLILGLDPGLVCTGFGLISLEAGMIRWRRTGTLRPSREQALPQRLLFLHQGLRQLLREHTPDAVAMEEGFIGRHPRAAMLLGHARSALMVAVLAEGIPLCEYAPRLVKLAVSGVGSASKQQVQAMVRHLAAGTPLGLTLDESDALAVAVCHAHRVRVQPGLATDRGLGGVARD